MYGLECYISMKQDGQSFTAIKKRTLFGSDLVVCSRNLKLVDDGRPNNYLDMAKRLNLKKILPDGFAIQGELCGPGIQHNKLKLDAHKLFVFNVFKNGKMLNLDDATAFCAENGLDFVPILDRFVMTEGITVESMILRATGLKYPCGGLAEGIVVRPVDPNIKGRLSFKVINPEFEAKY